MTIVLDGPSANIDVKLSQLISTIRSMEPPRQLAKAATAATAAPKAEAAMTATLPSKAAPPALKQVLKAEEAAKAATATAAAMPAKTRLPSQPPTPPPAHLLRNSTRDGGKSGKRGPTVRPDRRGHSSKGGDEGAKGGGKCGKSRPLSPDRRGHSCDKGAKGGVRSWYGKDRKGTKGTKSAKRCWQPSDESSDEESRHTADRVRQTLVENDSPWVLEHNRNSPGYIYAPKGSREHECYTRPDGAHVAEGYKHTVGDTPPPPAPPPPPRQPHPQPAAPATPAATAAPELTATPPVPVPKLAAASTQAVLQPPAQTPTAAAGSAGSGCAISVNLPEHFAGSMNFSLGPGRATSDAASNPDRSVSSVPAQATVGVRSSGRDRSVSPVSVYDAIDPLGDSSDSSVYDAIDPLGASLPHLRRVADGRFIPVEGLQGALRPTTGTISGLRRAHELARPSGIGDLSKFEAIQQGLMSKRTALNKKESSTRQHVHNVRKKNKNTKSQRSQVATAIKSAPPTRPRNVGMAQPVGPVGPVAHDHQDDVADPSRVDQLIQAKEQLEQYT